MLRQVIKYVNRISRGSIAREAEKTQSFIHEFLFCITERNLEPSQTSRMGLFGKIVDGLMPFSHFELSFLSS